MRHEPAGAGPFEFEAVVNIKPAPALRPIVPIRVFGAGGTDMGRVSDHDDDTTLVRPDLNLFLAADGAGGHAAGNVASALAAEAVAEFLEMSADLATSRPEVDPFGLHRDARRLATAVQAANRKVMKAAAESEARKGMGTTVVAAVFSPDSGVMHVAHVGDSRCYRLRDGILELLTFDHSLLNDVLELRPDLDDASLARFPPNVLTRALGMEDGVRVSVRTVEVVPGDRFVLCSDGLTDAIDPEAIASILALAKTPDGIVSAMIKAANDAGGPDNISAVVILCEAVGGSATGRQRMPLPRPRRKRSAPHPPPEPDLELSDDEESDDQPDLVMEDGEAEHQEEEAPDLEWDANANASSPDVLQVIDELFTLDTRVGAAIDRVTGRSASDGPEAGRCVKCTAAIDSEANFCGFCGARQSDAT